MGNSEINNLIEMEDIAHNLKYIPDSYGVVRALGIDTYPGEMAIVRELIQNADDSIDKEKKLYPTYIKFIIKENELIIEHDGKPFSKPPTHLGGKKNHTNKELIKLNSYDFVKISKIGLGKSDEDLTGKFGTGFTSVFHITDHPRIESNGWDFEIHIGKEPIIKDISKNGLTIIHLPFREVETEISSKIGAEIFSIDKIKKFTEQILKESYNNIFFLKHIKKIEIFDEIKPLYIVEKKESRKKTKKQKKILSRNVTIIIQNFENNSLKVYKDKWWFYTQEKISIPMDLKNLGIRSTQSVSIAIPKEKSGFSENFKISNYSYYTLPIKKNKFNFRYNASKFFTTTDRADFFNDGMKDSWNKWQLENLADLLTNVINELILTKIKPHFLYSVLPYFSDSEYESEHEYDKYLMTKFKEKVVLGKAKIFYTTKGKWVTSKGVYIGDERLEQILPKEKYKHFIDRSFTSKYKKVLNYYNIIDIKHDDLIDFLEQNQDTSIFENKFKSKVNNRKIAKLRLVYEYFSDCNLNEDEINTLKDINFILTEDGYLRSANYKVYFSSSKDMPLIHPDDIINHLIYTSRKSKIFLSQTLKITEFRFQQLITDSFLRRLEEYDENKKFIFICYLVERRKDVKRHKEILDQLKNRINDILVIEMNDLEENDIFFNYSELRETFDNKLNYLSSEYENKLNNKYPNWKEFFKDLGVKEIPNNKIKKIINELSEQGFSEQNAIKAEKIFRFISQNIKKINEDDLEKLRLYKWIPTINNNFEYPNYVYIDRKIKNLVGKNAQFISFSVNKEEQFVRILNMPLKPYITNVIDYLISHNSDINGIRDKKVDFKIYQYLDKNIKKIDEDELNKIKNNRIIWFNGIMWYPQKLFLNNHGSEFGQNGKIRGYLHKNRFKNLTDLCSILEIKDTPSNSDDYVDFLLDISDSKERIEISKWERYIENAYYKIAHSDFPLSQENIDKFVNRQIIFLKSNLERPNRCILIRKTDELYQRKLEKSGLFDVPFIFENDPKKESFFLEIGMKEIYDSIIQVRTDNNPLDRSPEWDEKLKNMIPWINGYGYLKLGDEGVVNHNNLENIVVYKVSGLKTSYGISYDGEKKIGNSIDDICCLETNGNKNCLFLDKLFDEKNNDHLQLLSTLLISQINQIDSITRAEWFLIINPYLNGGRVIGFNSFNAGIENTSIPTDEEPIDEEPTDEEPIDEEPTDEEPTDEEPIDEEPIDEELTDEEPIDEEPIDEELTDEELTDEEPIDEELTDEELTNEELTNEELTNEEPIDEELIDEEPIDEEPIDEEPIDEEPIDEELTNEELTDEELTDEEPIDEEPIDEEPIDEEPIDEEEPKKPQTKVTVTTIRDSKKSDWVKRAYGHHCQICLSFDKPELLSFSKSYTGKIKNRKVVIRAHHINEIVKNKGHDHTGNLISICHFHHMMLHKINFKLQSIEDQLDNLEDILIEWPSGKTLKWKILKIPKHLANQKEIQFVITPSHLKKIQEYINILSCEKKIENEN